MPIDPSTTAVVLSEHQKDVTPRGALLPSAVDQVGHTTDVLAADPMTSTDVDRAG